MALRERKTKTGWTKESVNENERQKRGKKLLLLLLSIRRFPCCFIFLAGRQSARR